MQLALPALSYTFVATHAVPSDIAWSGDADAM